MRRLGKLARRSVFVGALSVVAWCAAARPAPPVLRSSPCRVAPAIDGVDRPGEWDGAQRVSLDVAFASAAAGVRPSRRAELRVMNSSANLYVALRIPDASRHASLSPVRTDLAVLAFCRGAALAAGDDKRVVMPGLWADKHLTAPGKDADDARKDGRAAMRWIADGGGTTFVEMAVPLRSGDPNDIGAQAGGRLRLNLVYIDGFTADLGGTEVGGVYGGDTDNAAQWGEVELAAGVGVERPALAPAWLERLFPSRGKAGRVEDRLRRVEAVELDVNGRLGGAVVAEITFPGLRGQDENGQVRIFLPPAVREDPGARVPLIHVAGYEADEASASVLMAQGYAVCTPHAHPLNPLGRGPHLDNAILHAVRRLPCIDPLRVSVQGGSAGGWMTLMVAADAFPLVWAMPDVPPIHLGYNIGYIGEQQALAGPAAEGEAPRMPVLQAVGVIADQASALYGVPFDSQAYLAVSPLAHTAGITAPTLVTFSTADMLVPVDQVGSEFVRPLDRTRFPVGFTTAMAGRWPAVDGGRTLVDVVPASSRTVNVLPPVANPTRLAADGSVSGPAVPRALPYAVERPWSIVVIDEGPVEPAVGHFKFHWSLDHEPFRRAAEARGVTADQLTAAKLERLMRRAAGKPSRPMRVRSADGKGEVEGNLLDYAAAERADVVLGLTAFCSEPARARRFEGLYARLPRELRVLTPAELEHVRGGGG